ncbi:MAG: TIGR03086 family metal-binding protein [Actinomycetota bacterium]|jgi:uncharacterized protein (TIGR03086 family)|nr:TIGR03086 family metal-binding protein [Actinomycetota bacterium]
MTDDTWLRLHQLATGEFDYRIRQIPPEYWDASTPCDVWDVYELVNHNVTENLWVPVVLAGHAVEEVGGLDGDQLGSDPEIAWEDSWQDAVAAFADADLDSTVRLAAGTTTVLDYLRQRTADLTVHAWDLAVAISTDEELDNELVVAVYEWAQPLAAVFATLPQFFEPPITSFADADLQTRLLNLFGRES